MWKNLIALKVFGALQLTCLGPNSLLTWTRCSVFDIVLFGSGWMNPLSCKQINTQTTQLPKGSPELYRYNDGFSYNRVDHYSTFTPSSGQGTIFHSPGDKNLLRVSCGGHFGKDLHEPRSQLRHQRSPGIWLLLGV